MHETVTPETETETVTVTVTPGTKETETTSNGNSFETVTVTVTVTTATQTGGSATDLTGYRNGTHTATGTARERGPGTVDGRRSMSATTSAEAPSPRTTSCLPKTETSELFTFSRWPPRAVDRAV